MEIDAQKRLHGPWHYDEVIDTYNNIWIGPTKKNHQEWIRALKGIERKISSSKGAAKAFFQGKREEVVKKAELYQYVIEENQQHRARIREAKTFLVGPATLDSLLNSDPDSYDYIDLGQLPFDNLFFDPVRPPVVNLPITQQEGELIGVNLAPARPKIKEDLDHAQGRIIDSSRVIQEGDSYELLGFVKTSTEIERISSFFRTLRTVDHPEKQFFIAGAFQYAGFPYTAFAIDPLTKKVRIDVVNSASNMNPRSGVFPEAAFMENHKGDLHADLLLRLPALCVNLINYINSHNVTVIARNRKPRMVRYEGKFIEEPSSRRPFHLITVKDEEVEESREAQKSWELNWRVYVRGHPLKYRDGDGNIYLTTWRRPHVRGPPDAPWREQRYELLAKKLEEERLMYEGFELK